MFSGTGSATKAFKESDDWEVVHVDKVSNIVTDRVMDLSKASPNDFKKDFDFIWASPPCTKFSVAAIGHHWNKKDNVYMPKKESCIDMIGLVYRTLWIVEELDPDYWFMENPRAMLRKIIGMPQGTVTYCQYGDNRMKPTDLWGIHPDGFEYKSCSNGADCHQSASRGSKTGTQGIESSKDRARVPYGLSKAVFDLVETSSNMDSTTGEEQ